jgi:glycosyltransferase involved in cell wall biosynthesis
MLTTALWKYTVNVLHLDEQASWRGGEQQASWLMQGLAARGHRVFLAAPPDTPFYRHDHGGIAITRIPAPFRHELDLHTVRLLSRAMHEHAIDILHAHTAHAHSLACLVRMWARRGKVVVSRRVSYMPRRHWLNRMKYHCPDLFLSVSRGVDNVLERYGIPSAKRRVVHSAVSLERITAEPLPRILFGVPDSAVLLVSAGALVPQKDFETLLKAVRLLVDENMPVFLLVAGGGPLHNALEALRAQLNLDTYTRLLGHRDDAPRLIATADIYVSSSRSEGLGTSILEALGMGKPVVATDVGGVNEMVLHHETGLCVPPENPQALAEAIRWMITHPAEAARYGQRGGEHVRAHFTVDRMVEQTVAAYEALLG